MKTIINVILTILFTGILSSQHELPIINSVTPLSGYVGTSVQIDGDYFYFVLYDNPVLSNKNGTTIINVPPLDHCIVYFGTSPVPLAYRSTTRINFNIPNVTAGSYSIKVSNKNGDATYWSNFTVIIPPPPPIRDIAFVHGFNSNSTTWYNTSQTLYNAFNLNTYTNHSYDATISIPSSASSYASTLVPYSNSVVIAHSMGGLETREIKRQQGSGSNVRALITIGTPHNAAPITVNAAIMEDVLNAWVNGLASPLLMLGYSWSAITTSIIVDVVSYLDVFRNITAPYGLNTAAAVDMRPNSSFLQTLNSNPSATLPAAHYAIYGVEDWNSHYRLIDATLNSGVETGNVLSIVGDIAVYGYLVSGDVAAVWADYYYWCWEEYGDPDDYYRYWWYSNLAGAFYAGYSSLAFWQQMDWNQYLVGENATTNPLSAVNDGFIPTASQAPSFISSTRYIKAEHTNHAEETKSTESINRIKQALQMSDIGLQLR